MQAQHLDRARRCRTRVLVQDDKPLIVVFQHAPNSVPYNPLEGARCSSELFSLCIGYVAPSTHDEASGIVRTSIDKLPSRCIAARVDFNSHLSIPMMLAAIPPDLRVGDAPCRMPWLQHYVVPDRSHP